MYYNFPSTYCEQLHANKLENLEKMDKFLETYNLPKLNQEESENLNRQIIPSENEAVIKKTPNKQKPTTRWLRRWILPNIQEELTPPLLKLFRKVEEEGRLPNSFYKASIIVIPKPDKDTTKKIIGQYLWWT